MKNKKYLLMLALMISTITTSLSTEEHGNSDIYYSYNGLEDFGVEDAWNMGYTGKGVKIALIDTGIDFATPDLLGTQARISNSSSPYDGWPMVIDLNSLSSYQQGMTGSWYANTTSNDVEGYKVTGTSKSGIYHIGDHPDQHLANLYGQPVKVLVVDEKISGAYDTVYVDLNNNVDFRDDKPCRRGDEISYWDRDNDGYPDESGGMIYFIADGNTPLPLAKMLYGEETKIPKNGELVAFYIDSWLHGTTCASVIVGQGKNVKGIAPDAKIIPVRIFGQNDKILRLLASLGYDGVSNTGDEANIISGSIVNARLNTGVDEDSAFLEYLTTKVSPNTTMLYPIGNDGSGYGTCSAPSSEHVINVGAIYDHWWNGSSYKGDVTCFSSRGPNMLGQVKPNVLATSYSIPQSLPLWNTHNGKTAWEVRGRGTCATTPHVAAVIALIYQAYRDTYGEYPTSEKARDILMSSATDIDEEIFAQGAGIINAKRAVEIASGKDGILIEPALLSTTPVAVGSNLKFNLSISNYSEDSMNLTPLKLIIDKTKYVTLNPENESTFLPIPTDMLDCDLIKVSSYYPRTARNKMINEEYGYDLHLYNWKDVNGDEKVQESELEVLSGSFGDFGEGITSEVRMHHPAERMNDGILILLKKRGDTTIKDLRVVIETYKWTPWDIEINVNGDYVQLSIPTPNTTGVYQGKILLEYSDDKHCIPASFSTYVSDEIKVNNTKEIYENEKIHGRFEGDGYKWETKVYPIYHQGRDLAIISVGWDDPDTDIDVYIYNEDILNTSKLWKYPAKPPIELPKLKVLKESGHSIRNLGSIIHYRDDDYASVLSGPTSFYTSTGENKEEITGMLKDGLNFVILHQVFSGGNMYGENITIDVDITPLINISLNAKAGETVIYQPAEIDGIIGFSSGELFGQNTIQAEEGDVILIRSNETWYSPTIFFDSNENGMLDIDEDEVIFSESKYDEIDPSFTDVIPINKRGTYFLSTYPEFYGFYHLKNRYQCSTNTPLVFEPPKDAGIYLGIAEHNGNFISAPVKLVVEAKESKSIYMWTENRTICNLPFEIELELQDEFGNMVKDSADASIEFDNTTKNVHIINGREKITLKAPENEGRYKVKVESIYGTFEKYIEISDKDITDINYIKTKSEIAMKNDEAHVQAENVSNFELKKYVSKNIENVSIYLYGDYITLKWQASEVADHYNVYGYVYHQYRPIRDRPAKLAEVKIPEYSMTGVPWKSYTFWITAVNDEGYESEMSDPTGIVVIP